MAAYTRQGGIEFWFDFDNQALWNRSDEFVDLIRRAYRSIGDPSALAARFALSYASPDHPAPFVAAIAPAGDAFAGLFEAQQRIFDQHFADPDDLTQAFVDFGQGVLFDDRPPRSRNHFVHMMDGTPDTWIGWHRWHAAIRAAMLSGAPEDRCLAMLRRVGLSWAIQTEADPRIDARDNPGLAQGRIAELRSHWLNLSTEALDDAFVNNKHRAPRRAPARDAQLAALNPDITTHYARVTEILERAATDGDPDHSGWGRFWTLPLEEFMVIDEVHRNVLIAPPGADRGANSNLVKILKGLAVTSGNLPQMPLDRPPLSESDIAYIERWIDEGCNP